MTAPPEEHPRCTEWGHAWVLSTTEKVCARCGAVEQYQPSSFAGVAL